MKNEKIEKWLIICLIHNWLDLLDLRSRVRYIGLQLVIQIEKLQVISKIP